MLYLLNSWFTSNKYYHITPFLDILGWNSPKLKLSHLSLLLELGEFQPWVGSLLQFSYLINVFKKRSTLRVECTVGNLNYRKFWYSANPWIVLYSSHSLNGGLRVHYSDANLSNHDLNNLKNVCYSDHHLNILFTLCGLKRKRCGGRSFVEAWISNVMEQEFCSKYHTSVDYINSWPQAGFDPPWVHH